MVRRKSKFLTFCFSMFPGAGHMYIGFMKQGVSIMTSFFLLCFFSSWLYLGPLILFTPVLWFYSFFDVLNKNSMCDADFYAQEDRYLFDMNFSVVTELLQGKFRKILALCLIIIGGSLIVNNIGSTLHNFFPFLYDQYYYFFNRIPQLVIAVFIILAGIYLIKGKNLELHDRYNDPDFENNTFTNDGFQKDTYADSDFTAKAPDKDDSFKEAVILEPQILEALKEDIIKEAEENENP